ncbi:endonuclease/exonuclease/phosphatase family protein [Sunxiuqinia indica]|uniref:endonuclease/exonuclease/phosphatase family protein n=1 Tax=Sunxiuqinia indica TaxID=2692584 RepID=UPI00135C719A|nr:endonuclease/exonuclease/phosphatase family protein [Sunxiuqinia indica]
MKKIFRNIVLFLNLLAIFGLLISYLSSKISPATFWVPALFGLAYPYLLLTNILFVFLWLFSKTRYALLSLIVIAIGYSHLTHYFQFSGSQESIAEGLIISSYNVKNFYGNNNGSRQETALKVLDFFKEKEADIVCLQEVNLRGQKSFSSKSSRKSKIPFLNYAHASKKGGQVTYSRFPIIHKEEVHFENSSNMIIYSDLKINEDTIRLFNCHLESYRFSDAEINSLDSISFNKQEESLRKVRFTGSKLKQAFIKRTKQAEKLHQLVKDSPYEVLLCGDFNDTPVSYTYSTVIEGLEDAFVHSGSGIGNTYLGKLPSFRIDYIMHSPTFESYNFQVDKVDYSDHYPISCQIKITD